MPCPQEPVQTRYLIVFEGLALLELWDKVFLKIILEVTRGDELDLSFQQLIYQLTCLILVIRLGVNLFAKLKLFVKYLDQLLVSVGEAGHLLPLIIIKRPVEALEVLELILLLLEHGVGLPGRIKVRQVLPLHQVERVDVLLDFQESLLHLFGLVEVVEQDILDRLSRI